MIHDCPWFRNMLDNVGQKGIGICPRVVRGARAFYLEARPFDRETLAAGELRRTEGRSRGVAVAMYAPLRFCPSCGADLDDSIRENTEEFDGMVRRIRSEFPGEYDED